MSDNNEIILQPAEAQKIDFLSDYRGLSLYSAWLSVGNVGTIQDFIDYLGGGGGGDVTKVYVDQQDALKVDKVAGKSLILDTEIQRLATVTNQTQTDVDGFLNIDRTNGATDEFLNEKGEFVKVAHSAVTDKNSEADFQHLNAAEKLRVTNAQQLTLNTTAAQAGAATYTLVKNEQLLITGTLPSGVNSSIVLPAIESGKVNEQILHFSTGATLPTLLYSGFVPTWLNGTAISMKINKQYTIVFEQINGIVKTSWGEY